VGALHGTRREMHHAHATPACLDEGVGPDGSDGSETHTGSGSDVVTVLPKCV
jgi:hypothetical protein